MQHLNFQHLLYFWVVAKQGTIAKACETLFLTQPTISAQLKSLEKEVGTQLFSRVGRNLVLTDMGRTVFEYADEIFSLGRELQQTINGKPPGHIRKLVVGIADVLPRMLAYRLLEPVTRLKEPVRIVCHDDKTEQLLARLALGELDVVLSDVPASPFIKVRAYNHLLGECSVSLMGDSELVNKYKKGFPKSLDGAPFLMPMEGSSLRRSLDEWFNSIGVTPEIRGEFADFDLFEAFGSVGIGLFVVPTVVEEIVCQQHPVKLLRRVTEIKERFFAISVERRLKHAAVVAITDAARKQLFE